MVTLEDCQQAGSYEYKGLSTDTKPTNCYVNSLFLELDTGYFYYFDGSTWVKTKSGDGYSTFKSLIDRSITEVTEEMTEGVGYIGHSSFVGCSQLTKVTIGSSISGISSFAFWNCSALTSVDLSKGVTQIYDCAFENCSSLTNLKLGDRLRSIGGSSFKGCTGLPEIKIPDGPDGTETIGGSAFENCSGATKLFLPGTLKSIGRFAFKGCSSISSISIPLSITSIQEYTFENCSGATSLSLTTGTTKIGEGAFKGCSSLKSLNIPSTLTHLDNEAFESCSSLTSILYSGESKEGATSLKQIGDACFRYCTSLKYVWIPETTKRANRGDWTGSSFAYCTALKTVEIQDGVDRIGNNTFDGCTSLENINFPGTLGISGNIGIQAFRDCRSLREIEIGDGVKGIFEEAFIGCYNLNSVILPSSIETIGEKAFYHNEIATGMYTLKIYASTPPALGDNAISSWFSLTGYLPKIKVPSGSVGTYRNASGWSSFGDRIIEM